MLDREDAVNERGQSCRQADYRWAGGRGGDVQDVVLGGVDGDVFGGRGGDGGGGGGWLKVFGTDWVRESESVVGRWDY